MTAFLFFEALFQSLHQFFPAAERFDQLFFFFGEMAFREQFQPFFGDFCLDILDINDALEVRRKYAVVAIKVFFVFHQANACEMVKILNTAEDHLFLKGLD